MSQNETHKIRINETISVLRRDIREDFVQFEHTHDFVELVYVTGGEATQCVGEYTFDVKKGDMFFIDFGQKHSFVVKSGHFSYIDILFDPVVISEEFTSVDTINEIFKISIFKEFNVTDRCPAQIAHFKGRTIYKVETIINDMLCEFEEKNKGYVSVLSSYVRILFSVFLRSLSEKSEEKEKYINSRIGEIVDYINKHCHEKISLEELVKKSFYNPSYISQAFKKYCGKSLSRYVKEKRIFHAIEMLETTELSIEAISKVVGYDDTATFYKAFREIIGETPRKYVRNKSK